MAGKRHSSPPEKRALLLPRLKQGHGVQTPETVHWTARAQALHNISHNIDVQNSAEKGHSIPDLFSQSIQFEFELSARNPDTVGLWQGLIAALLLTDGSQMRVRTILLAALPNSPFARILRETGARRGVDRITLFELRRQDGTYGSVAFRFDHMPAMLCPAAELRGPFEIELPWLTNTAHGWTFGRPLALGALQEYRPQAIALRNELYALSQRSIPADENRDGLQLSLLREFFQSLDDVGDEISDFPVNERVRDLLFTQEPGKARTVSGIFTDRLCLFRIGPEHNRIHARALDSMVVRHGEGETPWHALLPLKRVWARDRIAEIRSGALRVSMRWRYGSVETTLINAKGEPIEFKRYRIQDLINLSNTRCAPQIAVWPPKSMPGWNRYYLMQYADTETLPLIASALDVQESTQEVTMLPRMPEGLNFTLFSEDVGMLAPDFDITVNSKSREMNIGFDFGTTGTTAYKYDPNSGITSPVSFANDGALFIFGRQDRAEFMLTARFVSERVADRATNYSLLRRKADPLQEGRSLIQTAVPFLMESRFDAELIRDVSDDLKWSALGTDKLRAHLFLEQYLMMCLWHALTNHASYIHWRASYPLAMLGRQQEDFIAKMQAIIGGLCTNCCRIPFDAYFCCESEAVGFMMMDNDIQAQYLEGLAVNDETGFFCIDIGGGTTDFSLWLGRKLLMQASLKWAGNSILCDTVTRENHGHEPRRNLIDSFFAAPRTPEHRLALASALEGGRSGEFRRVWNVLADEIADSIKGLHRTEEPLLNYMNILRFNLYLLFYFAGRMAREAAVDLPEESKLGANGSPLPVAVLGNGAKMLNMLYNDVELASVRDADGMERIRPQERRNASRYIEEKERMIRAFNVGCGEVKIDAALIEPFMPKQETARGLALAPEAYLLQRAKDPAGDARRNGWPQRSAYRMAEDGIVFQTMTDDFRQLVEESFLALREALDGDDDFRAFLSSIFDPPPGADKYSLEAYYRGVWLQCMRHNPEPTLPGQPLPLKNTNAGRFVEILAAMNRMMRTA
ncbi:MAG: hypothetical protein LBS72_05625 [Oscillospiraceae bacterium]|jgi:hypothetical protein|nr:hypothetical protein [Oscillospiraceae bacterium]